MAPARPPEALWQSRSDFFEASTQALAGRPRTHYLNLEVTMGSSDPEGYDLIVNATPLGMKDGDALPFDVSRIRVGTDMLFEQIPAYLEFFGFGSATPDELRAVS